jgi:DMSO/TMAO reductase YedYZ heme-binding membrane subunit
MYMLHDPSGTISKTRILRFIIVAFPTSTVLCLSYNDLTSFNIACVRLMKLFRWDEVRRFFYLYELKQR